MMILQLATFQIVFGIPQTLAGKEEQVKAKMTTNESTFLVFTKTNQTQP